MFEDINLWTVFTTGLLTGGLSCVAVQGGLLTACLAQREQDHLREKASRSGNTLPILSFLIAKLIAYTVLGALLGWLGEILHLSLQVQVVLQIFVVIFMLGTALNMLEVHPIFRYFAFQPPRFLTKIIHKQSRRNDLFAPAVLGAFTIFIPCGVTQAMMALAVGTGKPLLGAAVLFAFVLGTSPLFFLIGMTTMKLGDILKNGFTKVVAAAIIFLAFFTLNNTIALSGANWTFQNLANKTYCLVSYCDAVPAVGSAVSEQTITFAENGYSPDLFKVKAGSKVTLHLKNKNAAGCIQAFTIPSLNIQKIVPVNKSDTITFTAPSSPTEISFMCSMGMYAGTIKVI